MSLFFHDFRPGPGIPPDAPRATGLKRIWEMLSRDFMAFWKAGMLNLLTALPFAVGVSYAYATRSLLIVLLAGIVGGIIAAPGFYGLADTLLRSLRDEPGFWWHRYSRSLRQSRKNTLLPGALMGTVFSIQLFTLMNLPALNAGLGLALCQIVSMVVSMGIFLWFLPQQALLEFPFGAVLKNSLLLFFRYLPGTLQACAIMLYCM